MGVRGFGGWGWGVSEHLNLRGEGGEGRRGSGVLLSLFSGLAFGGGGLGWG